jgi:hypothetical protein
MRLKVDFNMDNHAFTEESEVRRILQKVSLLFERGDRLGIIHDSNGNPVGHWTVEDDA